MPGSDGLSTNAMESMPREGVHSTSSVSHRPPSLSRSPETRLGLAASPYSTYGTNQCDVLIDMRYSADSSVGQQTPHRTLERAVETEHQSPVHLQTPEAEGSPQPFSYSDCRISDSGFSRHDSLFSFGASSARNAAELKSLLGSSSSRLRRGATVLSRHAHSVDSDTRKAHAVSLEQAKSRARVEVDIVLESDCVVEGGYLRGSIRIRIRKRQKKEAPALLADGRVRVIGFECVPGERHHHTFYQRASALSAITDAHSRLYDSPPDEEGFASALEGVHILPFAMYLPDDGVFGSAKGCLSIQSGGALRYIAMM